MSVSNVWSTDPVFVGSSFFLTNAHNQVFARFETDLERMLRLFSRDTVVDRWLRAMVRILRRAPPVYAAPPEPSCPRPVPILLTRSRGQAPRKAR